MNAYNLPVPDHVLYQLALRAARGDHNLAESAVQHVRVQFFRSEYDPHRPFLNWAKRVISNHCTDEFRFRLRAVNGTDLFPDLAGKSVDQSALELAHDLTIPFCADDLRILRSWKPQPRLVMLGWSGLWGKLPPEDRAETLTAVKPGAPFPVPDFVEWPKKDRTAYLARVARCKPNTISQIRSRYEEPLSMLRFVRDLRDR